MQIKEKDFIEIEYTGTLKEEKLIFDTTSKDIAEKAGIFNPNVTYSPAIVCIGEKHVLSGLDQELVGKEIGQSYNIELKPDQAFGKKDPKLLKLIPTSQFKKQNLVPAPGMQINADGKMGLVRSVTGGRTFVDFNHPLAGKEVVYEVKVNRKVDNDEEKVKSLIRLELRIKPEHVDFKENNVTIKSQMDMPKEFEDMLLKRIQEIIPNVKSLKFLKETEEVTKNSVPKTEKVSES